MLILATSHSVQRPHGDAHQQMHGVTDRQTNTMTDHTATPVSDAAYNRNIVIFLLKNEQKRNRTALPRLASVRTLVMMFLS